MIEVILDATLTGIGTGFGVAAGTYLSNKMLIRHLDKLEKKLNKKKRGE